MKDKRWSVVFNYRSKKHGLTTVQHYVDELKEVHDLAENGPPWTCLRDISIVYVGSDKAEYIDDLD